LNAFSSPNSNYGFFVNQFSSAMYTVQAVVVSLSLVVKSPESWSEALNTPQSVFLIMGLLDGASSTLATMSGANVPGELQTILNQSIIPMTMLTSMLTISTKFKGFQLWGALLIITGACAASSAYFMGADEGSGDDGGNVRKAQPVAIFVFILSILPSALSNVYKEKCMKEDDMNEVHTTTFVSFWQVLVGFLFLPLMTLKSMGGVSTDQMLPQMYYGWVCFWQGENILDPDDNSCGNAFSIFAWYVFVNFIYNFLLLIITKRGSAVLLVISQALSLPVTNITFALPVIMGKDTESLTLDDLLGLVLVCIGFLLYSGFGFAEKFMVAQGPPGQMTFASVDKGSTIVVTKDLGNNPRSLASFLTRMAMQKSISVRREAARERNRLERLETGESQSLLTADGERTEVDGTRHARSGSGNYGAVSPTRLTSPAMDDVAATRMAIDVASRSIEYLQGKLRKLTGQMDSDDAPPIKQSMSPKAFKRLGQTTGNGSFGDGPAGGSGWSFYNGSSQKSGFGSSTALSSLVTKDGTSLIDDTASPRPGGGKGGRGNGNTPPPMSKPPTGKLQRA
jgi:hypothetical protein